MSVEDRIREIVSTNKVVLFMKGTRSAPQCGFSARTIEALDDYMDEYHTVDVIADPEIRSAIKTFTSWPTIPQLYVDGEFVGGCDIITEMNRSDELSKVLGVSKQDVSEPVIEITDAAVAALSEYWDGEGAPQVRFKVSPRFDNVMEFDEKQPGDFVIPLEAITLLVDRASARRADGVTIDFVSEPGRTGFRIENPQEPPRVKLVSAAELKSWLDEGKPIFLIDVRGEEERAIAKIDAAKPLVPEGNAILPSMDPDAVVVFQCHHGARSMAAAQHWLEHGLRNVYNLEGGIDAWSLNVDADIERY